MSEQGKKRWAAAFTLVLATMSASCQEVKFGGLTAREAFPDNVGGLVEAATQGDVKKMDELLQAGANVNATSREGHSPLMWTVGARNLKGAERLLQAGANPNYRVPRNGESAMSLAAGGNNPPMLELLLKHGGNPNLLGSNDEPLLAFAALYSETRKENVRLLLKDGADINGHDEFGHSAATNAVSMADFELVAYLLDQGFNYDLQRLATVVETRHIRPDSKQNVWKQKVIEMLKAREK